MQNSTESIFGAVSVRLRGCFGPIQTINTLLLYFLVASNLVAERIPPPRNLYDSGDFYLTRKGLPFNLWRSASEIAVKRFKELPEETVLRHADAERSVISTPAPGSPATHQIEILSVSDAGKALNALATLEGIEWVSPVFVVPGSGRRVMLCDEIAIELGAGKDRETWLKELSARGLTVEENPQTVAPGVYLLKLPVRNTEVALAEANALAQMSDVVWAEPNFLVELETYFLPNDPFLNRQQSLYNTGQNGALAGADVNAPVAWDNRTGHERLVVAILDTGVDIGHPDLNIFRNDNEWGDGRSTNGVDNDGNGYVDDYQGWDFWSWDNDPRHGTGWEAAHGTACAGVAGAVGNNSTGISGIAQIARILPVKVTSDDGYLASTARVGLAIRYAAQLADVISCSWGTAPSSAIESAIDYAVTSGRSGRGSPLFAASGNEFGLWSPRTRLVRFEVPSTGSYRLGFRCIARGNGWAPRFAIDQIRIMDQQGYNHLWQDDFEVPNPGWTVAHQGAHISDWWRTDETLYRRPGSIWCWRTPLLGSIPAGEWAELRSPTISLAGRHVLAIMTWGIDTHAADFQIRLLDANGQFIATIGEGISGGTGSTTANIAFPASYANAIAVGACSDLGVRSGYSRYGYPLFCLAPSNGGWNDIVTVDTRGAAGANDGVWNSDGDYRMSFGGTSAAAPLVAGVATLVLAKNANLTCQEVRDSLRLSCDKIGGVIYDATGWHPEYGYGRVNAHDALLNTPPDTTAPSVLSVVARSSRAVDITFSEPMGDGVTDPGNYTISGPGKGTLPNQPTSVKWAGGNQFILEWTGGEMLTGTNNVTVTVSSSVKDVAGNPIGAPNAGSVNGTRVIYQINCGSRYAESSYPIFPYESDRFWSGAGTPYGQHPVNAILMEDGTPQAVYGNERCVLCSTTYPGEIIYSLPGISAGVNHQVRLYFLANGYSINPGDVVFDVYINNILKLSNFDLIRAAGGVNIGIWREFSNITADAQGRIVIKVVPKGSYNRTWGGAWYYNATLSGIRVVAQ